MLTNNQTSINIEELENNQGYDENAKSQLLMKPASVEKLLKLHMNDANHESTNNSIAGRSPLI